LCLEKKTKVVSLKPPCPPYKGGKKEVKGKGEKAKGINVNLFQDDSEFRSLSFSR
jgi:hypothetical protein